MLVAELDKVLVDPRTPGALASNKDTICIGRSHGIHAEPTTFGIKLAILWDELRRGKVVRLERATREASVGKISGAVGTFAHLDPAIEAKRDEGARSPTPAPAEQPDRQRDRHAQLLPRDGAARRRASRKSRPKSGTCSARRCARSEEAFTAGTEGLSRDAAQAEPDPSGEPERTRAPDARLRGRGDGRRRALARARHQPQLASNA